MSIRMTIAPAIRELKPRVLAFLVTVVVAALAGELTAQTVAVVPPKKQQKRAAELIRRQEPPKVIPRVLERATPDNVSIYISLGKQRAYFRVDDEIAVDTPISSGKRAGMTPAGDFAITEKDADHRSNLYGDFVNPRTGRVVRAGVSTKIDSSSAAPSIAARPCVGSCGLPPAALACTRAFCPAIRRPTAVCDCLTRLQDFSTTESRLGRL